MQRHQVRPFSARSPPARRQVHPEEGVELDERRQHQENGVHQQADPAHPLVQDEFVQGEGDVQHQQRGQQGDGAVFYPRGVYPDLGEVSVRIRRGETEFMSENGSNTNVFWSYPVFVLQRRHEGRFDEPREAEAEQDVEGVRAYGVAYPHRTMACNLVIGLSRTGAI